MIASNEITYSWHDQRNEALMENRAVPNTELSLSRVCLGTMTFGAQTDEAIAAAMLDCCLERGVSFVDTANVYNGGRAEEIVGRLLKGRRDKIVLASKVGIRTGLQADEEGLSRAAILNGIENSLRRLGTDYLDIYYLHTPDYHTRLEESLATMEDLVRQGKVRCLGASNYASWQVCRMLWLAEQNGWQPVRIVKPMYNLLSRGIEQELLPMCKQFSLATAVYNPLAGGLLTGKHRIEATLPGTRFDGNEVYRNRYWHAATFAAIGGLAAVANEAGTSLVGLSLRWLLQQSPIDTVILGASRLEQLEENLVAVERGSLPAEAIETCDRIWLQLRGASPQYNR